MVKETDDNVKDDEVMDGIDIDNVGKVEVVINNT